VIATCGPWRVPAGVIQNVPASQCRPPVSTVPPRTITYSSAGCVWTGITVPRESRTRWIEPSLTGCASGSRVTPGRKSIEVHPFASWSIKVCLIYRNASLGGDRTHSQTRTPCAAVFSPADGFECPLYRWPLCFKSFNNLVYRTQRTSGRPVVVNYFLVQNGSLAGTETLVCGFSE
jgi:hypothetical protein